LAGLTVPGSRMLRLLQGRHAFRELGVSWGGSVPCGISACRNLRCRDSALSRTLAEVPHVVGLRSFASSRCDRRLLAATRSAGAVCAGHRNVGRMFAEWARPALLLRSLGPSLCRALTAPSAIDACNNCGYCAFAGAETAGSSRRSWLFDNLIVRARSRAIISIR
jgi:hypothetical protein